MPEVKLVEAGKETQESSGVTVSVVPLPLNIDKAGNVAERDKFMWTYQARLVSATTQTKKTVETLALAPGEARDMGCPVSPGGT